MSKFYKEYGVEVYIEIEDQYWILTRLLDTKQEVDDFLELMKDNPYVKIVNKYWRGLD